MSHLLSGFYYYRSPSCLKVSGWGQVVAHKILGSAPIPFGFRSYWDLAGVWPRGFWDRALMMQHGVTYSLTTETAFCQAQFCFAKSKALLPLPWRIQKNIVLLEECRLQGVQKLAVNANVSG